MERFIAYVLISLYIIILASAVYFAIYTIKQGKMEPEKDIKITSNKGQENANHGID